MLLYVVIFPLLCAYFYLKKSHKKNNSCKFPEPPAHLLLGHKNFMVATTDTIPVISQLLQNHGKTVKLRAGPSIFPIANALVTSDHKFVEFVLSKTKILTKSGNYKFLRDWLGNGLLISDGDYWKRHRKILTPAFHFETLKQFVEVFESVGDVLIGKLRECKEKSSVDVQPLVTLCTLDIICETAMSTKINAQSGQNSEYVQSVHNMGRIISERTFSPMKIFNCTYWLFSDYYLQKNVLKMLHGFTQNIINSRKSEPARKKTKRVAFLDLLLVGNFLSINKIREEVDTFMAGGYDTTSAGLSFILYCLANHPELQKTVLQEQTMLFGDEKNPTVTYPDLQNMHCLDCVIKETFRLYPPVPIIGRRTTEEVNFDGYSIPKITDIVIFIYGLHRSLEYFQEPEKFNPERFEHFNSSFPYAYIPFSAGPRNCIGQKFATLEMKSVISKIVRYFETKPTSPKHEVKLSAEGVLRSANGFCVALKNRD